jgi:glutamate-1-semialdehyde 2,1-aminomutase
MKAHALKWPAPAQETMSSTPTVAKGAYLTSGDGRTFVDFHNAAGSVLLGHADPQVEAAVGVCAASHLTRLQAEVAERLLSFMPLAQAVYLFSSPALAYRTALDLVRAASGRDLVLTCAPGRQAPDTFPCGDLDALEALMDSRAVAGVVAAPVGLQPPCPSYLAGLRALASRHGAFLIFDETASAFRVHEGGAQTLFNVRPDLTLIGESLANGRPIAALAGDPILLATAAPSRPPGADALAAAAATLAKLDDEPVTTTLGIRGAEVQAELAQRIDAHGAGGIVAIAGDPTMTRLVFADPNLDAVCLRDCWLRGVWRQAEHFISYAHGDREIAGLIDAYDQILPELVRRSGDGGVVRLQSRLEREFTAQ